MTTDTTEHFRTPASVEPYRLATFTHAYAQSAQPAALRAYWTINGLRSARGLPMLNPDEFHRLGGVTRSDGRFIVTVGGVLHEFHLTGWEVTLHWPTGAAPETTLTGLRGKVASDQRPVHPEHAAGYVERHDEQPPADPAPLPTRNNPV